MIDGRLTPSHILDTLLRHCVGVGKTDNYVHDNEDAGLSIMESSNCLLYDNEVVNHDTGVRIVLGGEFNEVRNNVFENCRKCECCLAARLVTYLIVQALMSHRRGGSSGVSLMQIIQCLNEDFALVDRFEQCLV